MQNNAFLVSWLTGVISEDVFVSFFVVLYLFFISAGMGIVRGNSNFCDRETDFPQRKEIVCGERK